MLYSIDFVVCLVVSSKRRERWRGWGWSQRGHSPWDVNSLQVHVRVSWKVMWVVLDIFLKFSLGHDVCSCSAEHRDLLAACTGCDEHQHCPPLCWRCWMCVLCAPTPLPTCIAELCVGLGFVWDCQAPLFTVSLPGGVISSFIFCLF